MWYNPTIQANTVIRKGVPLSKTIAQLCVVRTKRLSVSNAFFSINTQSFKSQCCT